VRTYHVEDAECLDAARGVIRHRPIGMSADIETPDWLGGTGPVTVGLTAGASTPNNKIGEAVARVFATRGIDPGDIV
jgi:4-hydroxy-3-methylbut-2-enyl diphosphate reductase